MNTQTRPTRRVGDVAPSGGDLQGDQHKVRDLVGKEIVITRIEEWQGEKGPYLAVEFEHDGAVDFFFTSHKVVKRKLDQCREDLPLLATITRCKNEKTGQTYFDIE